MNNYINRLSGLYIEQINNLLGPPIGSDISYFHKQTEYTLISQLLQELTDLGLLCLQKCLEASL